LKRIIKTILTVPLLLIADTTEPFEPHFRPTIHITESINDVIIDGDISDSEWKEAAIATGFSEVHPGENTKPPVETIAKITHDRDNIYVAFIAKDDPALIRANLRNRDEIFQDDFVGITLDTYGDASQSFSMISNPFGIQGDFQTLSAGGEDINFDLQFESAGKITENGYEVEMAIPFSSLRFPKGDAQEWRISFFRTHPRSDVRRQISWVAVDRNNPCMLCQLGYLTGLSSIDAKRPIEWLPSMVASQTGALDSDHFVNKNPTGEISLGVRLPISSDATAELTINPDFSQVEADAEVIDVNNPFALSYPEKRPFFNEGSDLYSTGDKPWKPKIKVVYTRSINDPIAAGKFVGRSGNTKYGYIGAVDENTLLVLPFEEASGYASVGRSVSNIFRVKRSMENNSYFGATMTDRRFGNGGNTVISGDGLLRFGQNYAIDIQAIASYTLEPDDSAYVNGIDEELDNEWLTAEFDGERFIGRAFYGSFSREGRNWGFDIRYNEKTPTFRADNGFVSKNNSRGLHGNMYAAFYPQNRWIKQYHAVVGGENRWNFSGVQKGHGYFAMVNMSLAGQINLEMFGHGGWDRYGGVLFENIWNLESSISTHFSDKISFGAGTSYGRTIIRDSLKIGNGISAHLWSEFRPTSKLSFGTRLKYRRASHLTEDRDYYNGMIANVKLNYLWNKALSFRLITQYNGFYQTIDVQPLLSYQLSPFTIFYIGSAHGMIEDEYEDIPTQTSRQYFLKFQYLFKT